MRVIAKPSNNTSKNTSRNTTPLDNNRDESYNVANEYGTKNNTHIDKLLPPKSTNIIKASVGHSKTIFSSPKVLKKKDSQ